MQISKCKMMDSTRLAILSEVERMTHSTWFRVILSKVEGMTAKFKIRVPLALP